MIGINGSYFYFDKTPIKLMPIYTLGLSLRVASFRKDLLPQHPCMYALRASRTPVHTVLRALSHAGVVQLPY